MAAGDLDGGAIGQNPIRLNRQSIVSASGRIKVLFLCTGNCCRSQMAEAILAHAGGGRFLAFSAGSDPAGFIHPLAIEALKRLAIPIPDGASSKRWDVYADESFDAIITLCDSAASEPCPIPPEAGVRAHWSLPDPAYQPGSEEDRIQFAVRVAERLMAKCKGLLTVDWSAPRAEIEGRLAFLGEI